MRVSKSFLSENMYFQAQGMDEHINGKGKHNHFFFFLYLWRQDQWALSSSQADKKQSLPRDEGLAEVNHDFYSLLCQEAMVC